MRLVVFIFCLIFSSLLGPVLLAQSSDSLPNPSPTDSLNPPKILEDSSSLKKTPSTRKENRPRKALIWGAFVPGGGQIYNRKYWKLPIVYLGFGGLGYWTANSYTRYRCYRRSVLELIDDDPTTNYICPIPGIDNPSLADLNTYRQRYRTQYERGILFTSVFYVLVLADAFVDAHLYSFDVNDDLSLSLGPKWPVFAFDGGQPQLSPSLALRCTPRYVKPQPKTWLSPF